MEWSRDGFESIVDGGKKDKNLIAMYDRLMKEEFSVC